MTKLALSHKIIDMNRTSLPMVLKKTVYIVSYQQTDSEILYLSNCSSLNESRITISNYILEILNETANTVFNQLCKKPGREKDRWDQWRVSQFI